MFPSSQCEWVLFRSFQWRRYDLHLGARLQHVAPGFSVCRDSRCTLLIGNPETQVLVRSDMGAYAGAARRRVHLGTVLLRPPSGHRPGRRQARLARILQIGLHLTQPRGVWAPPRHGPYRKYSEIRISRN